MGAYQCKTAVLAVLEFINAVVSASLPAQYYPVQVILTAINQRLPLFMAPRFAAIVGIANHYVRNATHDIVMLPNMWYPISTSVLCPATGAVNTPIAASVPPVVVTSVIVYGIKLLSA